MMDELPAIIHKLSLRLWCPDSGAKEEQDTAEQTEKLEKDEVGIDPFSSPPLDAVDARGNVLDASEISSLCLDGGAEIHSLFSQKNLLRLSALTNSHRTLSLYTPSIRDAVFRAWAGPTERDFVGTATPSLIRSNSTLGSTTYTFSNRGSDDGHIPSRPSLTSLHSATTGLSLGSGRSRSYANKKKKNRVVNLRRSKTTDDIMSESGDSETSSVAPPASEPAFATPIPEEPEDAVLTPPQSPSGRVRFRTSSIDLGDTPRKLRLSTPNRPILRSSHLPEQVIVDSTPTTEKEEPSAPIYSRSHRPSFGGDAFSDEKRPVISSSAPRFEPASVLGATPGIVEQAWILKMAGEIARRAQDAKAADQGFWSNASSASNADREDTPPPAYQPKA